MFIIYIKLSNNINKIFYFDANFKTEIIFSSKFSYFIFHNFSFYSKKNSNVHLFVIANY